MLSDEEMIRQTRSWIRLVVAGSNFCPFVARELKNNTIHYQVAAHGNRKASLSYFKLECERLDKHPEIETSLLIFPHNFEVFEDYLELVNRAEKQLLKNGYEGIYQVAGFHPLYCFAGADESDPANYTNRSVYPMLHLLREESIDRALEKYTDPEGIPQRNINFARNKGIAYMKMLREQCL
ncbi:MAG: DUF1415 domain-containing protein [Bacteroidia bacterium]|nr:DUF1415 domain-containing protein [Bacteroidia bacterium]